MEINGYPNYLIYKDGRVFSKKRNIFMKQCPNSDGYLHLNIYHNCKKIQARVHRLVAEHYIPNPDNKPTIDHIDRNRQNNDVSNLCWATRLEQGQNKGTNIKNTSGHKGINKDKSNGGKQYYWSYGKIFKGKLYKKSFKSKMDALCFKYIVLLKIKSGVI